MTFPTIFGNFLAGNTSGQGSPRHVRSGRISADPTEGITQPQDLPKAKIISKSLQFEFVVFFSVSLVVQSACQIC